MLLSKEYVGYLARQVTQKLIAGDFIETKNVPAVSAALNNALLEELQLEDRINDEVRLILEQYQDEMQRHCERRPVPPREKMQRLPSQRTGEMCGAAKQEFRPRPARVP